MADHVTIRHPQTGVEKSVAKSALAFFKGWEQIDKTGKPAANQPAALKES